jgi:hypothetical protein
LVFVDLTDNDLRQLHFNGHGTVHPFRAVIRDQGRLATADSASLAL